MLDIDKKFELIAVADLVRAKNFKNELQTCMWSKWVALKKDTLECSQETQLKTILM